MAKRLFSILLLCFASPAFGAMPPEEYDRPFPGKMEKHLVAYGQAAKKCRALGATVADKIEGRHLFGCQMWRDETCVIVYSYDPTNRDRAMMSNVFRHERAHCNGWPADHPQ